jgi:hypothetical protein
MAGDQIKIIMAGLDLFTADRVRDLTFEITANLNERTPVDIGWARANWIPSVGRASAIVMDGKPERGDVTVALGRQSAGLAQIASYRLSAGSTFVSNNAPYIRRLNDGWSKQAPRGFIQTEIRRAVRTVKARYKGR